MTTTSDGTFPTPPGETRAEKLAWIVRHGQAGTVDGEFIDMTTANMLMTVYDAIIADSTRAIWDAMPIRRVVDLGWKAVTPK